MYHSLKIEDILKIFNSDPSKGLSSQEVEKRKIKYGLNKLATQNRDTLITLIWSQINDILIYILIGAAIISFLVGETSDAIIIGIIIILNSIVGVTQEYKAEKSLETLQNLSTPKAIVKRNAQLIEIPSEEIVPGDIIIIDAGRYIPCDLRLIETVNLKIEESALTGESIPVDKDANLILEDGKTTLGDQKNMAFMSTLATHGRGIGVAVSTGMNTEIGKIASLLKENKKELTPLQKKLEKLGKTLGIAAISICALMFLIGFIQGRDLFELFLTSISLAVAAIPEGLPAIVTIVLALSVQRMIKENAIIRKLPAVETLGSVNIICSDKTGTLTQNKMTVTKFYADNIFDDIKKLDINNKIHKLLIENLVLCNDATSSKESSTGDPTEIALLDVAASYNIFKDELQKEHERVNEIPFDSDRKLMTTVNKYKDNFYVMTKGAVDNLLKICTKVFIGGIEVPLTDNIKDSILKATSAMSSEALRVLGAAYKIINDINNTEINSLERDLVFIGLVGMIDPPRLEVKNSISLCKKAGISTVMITGDHKDTAFAVAKSLNIAENPLEVISGLDLDKLSQEELNEKIMNLKVFARVSPEHKVKIVKAFKSKGNIVSMTGDGINDAPSLKIADIGVSMGITGTDVAKEASDMILTDDNFSTIVSAIEEGRNIYNNIKKSILFLISCNIGEIMSIFFSILLGWASPLRSIHILWVNLITDSFPALALGVDPKDDGVMKEKPRNSNETIFTGAIGNILFSGSIICILTLIAFQIGLHRYPGSVIHAQTMAFITMSISELIHSLNMRNEKKSIFKIGFFTNRFLIFSIVLGIILQIIILYVPYLSSIFSVYPLNSGDWKWIALLSLMPLFISEILKILKSKI
ncbi:calcium-translocating P-type ATPase, PMCA-type [Clostridium thermopalmarium]|uniref:P-type Ca(2+) transporter n=1 Tax=Clostridium thermopalmarium DSM 5974 TaxID=1121340 RepID=A0A2T0AM56_9CLOT|nr:calcium-translocating P-type ATPase, PMCA-type [Clostridium thermopalmarium]PRR69828.1 Calcium-transporting ATPase 1 [Clostridium thermopalmarium DSM 5974]PVZ21607.1 Ca2+-transporting ATPase [Clostridium thermopalmarium DSM 5974]